MNENAVLEVRREVRDLLDGAEHVAVHAEADDASAEVTQRLRLRSVSDVAREIDVELETQVVDLFVGEVVAGEDERRDQVGVAQPRSAAAARQEAENVAHHVGQRRRRVRGAGEHGGAVRGQVKTGAVLGARVAAVLPLGAPVLHERQLQRLDRVAVCRRRPHDVLRAGRRAAGSRQRATRAAATDRRPTVGVRDQSRHERRSPEVEGVDATNEQAMKAVGQVKPDRNLKSHQKNA